MSSSSSFYCYKKQCRKTLWDTPEYINKADRKVIARLIECLEKPDLNGYEAFNKILNSANKVSKVTGKVTEKVYQMFFDRVVGWPEGVRYYMRGSESYRSSYCNWLQENSLDKIKSALRK
jgi:hypothetical protein